MTIRTILAPVAGSGLDAQVLDLGFRIARRFDAHLEVLFVAAEPQDVIPIVGEGMSGLIIEEMMNAAEKETAHRLKRARESYDSVRASAGCDEASSPRPTAQITCAWRQDSGREDETVARRGRLFDLLVIGRDPKEAAASLTFDAALMETGRPVLVAPVTVPATIGDHVMIAWNGGVEAARAVTSSMPLLRQAKTITIVSVGDVPHGRATAQALAEQFLWHGVDAHVDVLPDQSQPAKALISAAEKHGVDCVVLGAYSHSRFKEMILGGVTQDMLAKCPLPLWIMH
ncbi:MAG: universal stress protein [Pseudomonadota bacterium]